MMDRTEKKKQWLAGFAWTGAGFASLLWFCRGENWQIGAVAVIGANLCLAAAMVVNDSILPLISDEANRDRVSSRGWAFGYLGGGLLLAVNLAVVTILPLRPHHGQAARHLHALGRDLVGGLHDHPVRAAQQPPARPTSEPAEGNVVARSFGQLAATLRDMRNYPVALTFLRRLPVLQRRHPDRHRQRLDVRRRAARPRADRADRHHPDGPVRRVLRRAALRPARPAPGRQADDPGRPGDLDGRS